MLSTDLIPERYNSSYINSGGKPDQIEYSVSVAVLEAEESTADRMHKTHTRSTPWNVRSFTIGASTSMIDEVAVSAACSQWSKRYSGLGIVGFLGVFGSKTHVLEGYLGEPFLLYLRAHWYGRVRSFEESPRSWNSEPRGSCVWFVSPI